MQYKRLEIYTGWKCNHKCVFCIEFPNMEKTWDKTVSREEMMKKLIKYRKQGYNHVTFLGGEPFIHPVLHFATRFAKKLGYTTLVTTNASTLQFEKQAEKHLPSIDQIFISLPSVDPQNQLIINDTKGIINFENVFQNIEKYWKGNFLKVNTVINQYNLEEIEDIIEFLGGTQVHEISLTYPDIIMPYYSKEHVLEKVAPSYSQVRDKVKLWLETAKKSGISIKLVDIPFCTLPNESYIEYTDDYCYQTRLKVSNMEEEISRDEYLPRRRKHVSQCSKCAYNDICWGPSFHYQDLYAGEEIVAFKTKKLGLESRGFLQQQKGTA